MKLLTPAKIGNMVVKNRVFMCPMGTTTEADGSYSDRDIRYLAERAKGGVGLIIPGGAQAWTGIEGRLVNAFGTGRFLEQLDALARQIHENGAKLGLQLVPGAGRVDPGHVWNDYAIYSASAVNAYWFPDKICKPIEKDMLKTLVTKMGEAAALAKSHDVDCVEMHFYGGYLTDQFMCSLWNKRTDEYGGNLEGRMRLPLEIIAEIRKTCGKDYPIIVKFTPYHGIEGGRELDEGIKIAKMFEAAGVDALHIDVGCYEVWHTVIPSVYDKAPTHIHIAEEIKKHVNIPILAHGKLNDPMLAEQVLQEGKTDFIGMGHGLIADPEWVNKVRNHRTYDIVPCIGCNECLRAYIKGKNTHCSVNPRAFDEAYVIDKPVTEKKKLLVVGAGPGGINAAIRAAERGHYVELWEKTNQIGGNLLPAGGPKFKRDVSKYVDYLRGKLFRSNVVVKMMKEATAEEIRFGGFDKVILATGSTEVAPPIPGLKDNPSVVKATDVLVDKAGFGKNVVVIGGGDVGCETACYCAEKADSVTIIEMLDDILLAAQHCRNNEISLRTMVKNRGVELKCSAKINKIDGTTVEYEQEGKTKTLKVDTIVLATGRKANNELYDQIIEHVDTELIGDADKPDRILSAVHKGFHIANNL